MTPHGSGDACNAAKPFAGSICGADVGTTYVMQAVHPERPLACMHMVHMRLIHNVAAE